MSVIGPTQGWGSAWAWATCNSCGGSSVLWRSDACFRPSPPPPPGDPAPIPHREPRLLLDLALDDSPDQPGRTPSRVGGVEPKGPLGLAVAPSGEIYLLDQAKGRVLVYVDGRLQTRIPTPWLDAAGGDIRLEPEGLVVADFGQTYRLADGRIAEIRATAPRPEPTHGEKGPIPLGAGAAFRYERAVGTAGPVLRRVSQDGTVLAEVPITVSGEIVDWYVTPEEGVYALASRWGKGQIDRALVYEMLPPVGQPTRAAQPPEPAQPLLFNRPVPAKIRLVLPDWVPLEVTDAVALWNLWRLLATAGPAHRPLAPHETKGVRLEATFADGQSLTLDLYGDLMAVAGSLYRVEAAVALRRQVGALLLSPEGLAAALTGSRRTVLVMTDLPGVSQTLTAEQRQQLAESLQEVLPVHPHAMPQPLEAPFPQYAIRFKGAGWEGSVILRGNHHLALGSDGAVAHTGRLAGLVRQWLPVPDFRPEDVAYLYLADRVEIGDGGDITRWKNTIVRHLLQVTPLQAGSPWKGAVTFTFHVKGEKRVVTVDASGFTYAGQRYDVPGLNHLIHLQGVP